MGIPSFPCAKAMTPRELVDLWYADTNSKCWLSQEALAALATAIEKLLKDNANEERH